LPIGEASKAGFAGVMVGRMFKLLPTPIRIEARYAFVSKMAPAEILEKARRALQRLVKQGDIVKIQSRYRWG